MKANSYIQIPFSSQLLYTSMNLEVIAVMIAYRYLVQQ